MRFHLLFFRFISFFCTSILLSTLLLSETAASAESESVIKVSFSDFEVLDERRVVYLNDRNGGQIFVTFRPSEFEWESRWDWELSLFLGKFDNEKSKFATCVQPQYYYIKQCFFQFEYSKLDFALGYEELKIVIKYNGKTYTTTRDVDLSQLQTPKILLNSVKFSSNGQFSISAKTQRQNTLDTRVPGLIYRICIEGMNCRDIAAANNGSILFRTQLPKTKPKVKWSIEGTLNGQVLDHYCYPADLVNWQRRCEGSAKRDGYKRKPTPAPSMTADLTVPIAAKLGVPFATRISIFGQGTAQCRLFVARKTHELGSYSGTGWYSEFFMVKAQSSVVVNALMRENFRGVWGVFLFCRDVERGKDLYRVLKEVVQNG